MAEMLQDRENDVADLQKQLQKAKTLADTVGGVDSVPFFCADLGVRM